MVKYSTPNVYLVETLIDIKQVKFDFTNFYMV